MSSTDLLPIPADLSPEKLPSYSRDALVLFFPVERRKERLERLPNSFKSGEEELVKKEFNFFLSAKTLIKAFLNYADGEHRSQCLSDFSLSNGQQGATPLVA